MLGTLLVTLILVGCRAGALVSPADPPINPSPTATTVGSPADTTLNRITAPTNVKSIRTWTDADSKATQDFVASLRKDHPDAAWPHWFADKILAWTSLGLDGGGVEGLIATDGTISPNANTVGIDFWLRDEATGKLYTPQPNQVSQSLSRGQLPVVTSVWKLDAATLSLTVFARSTGTNPIEPGPDGTSNMVVEARLTGAGASHPWTLYVVARPYGPAGGESPIQQVNVSPNALSVDQHLLILPLQTADVAGALNETSVDASLALARNPSSLATSATSRLGLAEGILGYHVNLAANKAVTLGFVMPMQPAPTDPKLLAQLRAIDPATSQQQVENAWWTRLHRVELSLPDQASVNAYYASLAYLLMARRGDQVSPGAMNLHRMWVRDAMYILDALDKTGNSDLVGPVLRGILAAQLPSGRFPPIINADGTAQQPLNTEWDTEGEAITALVFYAQDTENPAFVRTVYPNMLAAARYQQQLIQQANAHLPSSSPFAGLLPAGDSAEDLYGNGKWHHLWDDLWAIAGFQETAAAARQYGSPSDAGWLSDAASNLQAAVLRVGNNTRAANGTTYLPNGPEDHIYTAMSRSVTPAIWPVVTLDPNNPLVQRSFQYYYTQTVAPYHGAYLHYGDNFWPYAGISLAHAFYRLGRVDYAWTMYQWAMQHQTAPNLYSWPEAINRHTLGQANGDMPNSWMSAEMILLTRDVLVHEDGDHLDLGPYFDGWLPAGGTISIGDFPTTFGPLSYTLTRSADGQTLSLTLSGASPPGGYQITAPGQSTFRTVQIDGAAAAAVTGPAATIPRGSHQVTLTLSTR